MNNTATRMIRSEEITIDMRICTILAGGKKPGEVYFAAIAPDMELTVITWMKPLTFCPASMKAMPASIFPTLRCCSATIRHRF